MHLLICRCTKICLFQGEKKKTLEEKKANQLIIPLSQTSFQASLFHSEAFLSVLW